MIAMECPRCGNEEERPPGDARCALVLPECTCSDEQRAKGPACVSYIERPCPGVMQAKASL